MSGLEARIGYAFADAGLLETALTHASFANEQKRPAADNERLEFLGDSVLSFVVSDELYTAAGRLPEGELTRRRAALVNETALAGFAAAIELGQALRLGKGEAASGGRRRPSILADAFEALIAAIYLDGGIEAARAFILPFVRGTDGEAGGDYKTRLQELAQREAGARLNYAVTGEEGPDHNKRFTVRVELNGRPVGTGRGHSKKLAEQNAARDALAALAGGEV
jgi:ribonuclease-3